ncbi:MAG: carboxyl-terminal processing protease [Bradymonadia bacterium]|jgi:carboxyl-terminal processing protease
MRNSAYIRYAVAVVALMLGFALTIRLSSDRGLLFESAGTAALASAQTPSDQYDLQGLAIVNRVLLQLTDNYVEPDRIEPDRMLVYALDRVQNTVPEVVTLFDEDLDSSPGTVEVRVGSARQTFAIEGIESRWEMSLKLREIFRFMQQHLDADETDLQEVEYAAINGLLSTLDPHSVLLTPRVYADMQASNRGSFGGLGIVIGIRDAALTVISPIANTPAARAGFESGDRIVKINDESTVNMPLDEAVNRLRGAPGTEVTLEVMRDNWTEPHEFTLVREIISIESVTHETLGDNIGYISIQNFQANTHDDLLAALESLETELGGIEGLVLDLRNNPGGLLQQAIAISDTFLSEGTIVTTVGIGDRLREENVASANTTQGEYPIVILINPGSASASEIVAGALKSHNRALIVGDTSFGKGSVQVIYAFEDGSALKLTIAKYLTPGDVSIQGVGIVPDIQIVPMLITEETIDMYASTDILREGDLATALASSTDEQATSDRPSAVVQYFFEPEEIDSGAMDGPNDFSPDFEIDFARSVLRSAGAEWERERLLSLAGTVIDDVAARQLVTVQERLRQRNVDWSEGPNVIQPVTLAVTTDRADNRLSSGGTLAVTLSATNNGDRALHQVRAVTESAYRLFDDREFVFGLIEPGETATWTVPIEIPVEEPTRLELVSFAGFADTIPLDATTETRVEVVGQARPHWGFSYWLDDTEGGNGDGLLQVGETVRFRMDVTNIGDGAAAETVIYLRNRSDADVFLRAGREEVDHLGPGEHHVSVFEFDVQGAGENGTIVLDADVYDSVFREFLSEELTLPVTSPESAATVSDVTGGIVASSGPLEIYAGAADHTPIIARAPEGATLEVVLRTDDWFKVTWGELDGWVPNALVTYTSEAVVSDTTVEELVHFQAPVIALDSSVTQTSAATFTLDGSISDDRTVRDFYVSVYNRVSPARTQLTKVAYQYLGVPSATIAETIPLRPGMNRITVVARDNDKITSSQVLFVYRNE